MNDVDDDLKDYDEKLLEEDKVQNHEISDDELKEIDLSTTEFESKRNLGEKKNKDYKRLTKRITLLVFSIILMSFAQSIFNFTSPIGMAPIDSGIKSLEEANPWGLVYTDFNYMTVAILVIIAILLSPKEKKLITSTSFITGYLLAFLVAFFSTNIVSHFPGFHLGSDGEALLDNPHIYNDFDYRVWLWFFLAYFLLTLSIGMWANAEIGLRPYDAVMIRASQRPSGRSYVFTRNMSDSILVLIAVGFSTLGFLINSHPEKDGYFEYLTIGVGTILIVCTAGIISNFWMKIFKRMM